MTLSERADAMGYGRRCCARCEHLEGVVCRSPRSDVAGENRCLGDLCKSFEARATERQGRLL